MFSSCGSSQGNANTSEKQNDGYSFYNKPISSLKVVSGEQQDDQTSENIQLASQGKEQVGFSYISKNTCTFRWVIENYDAFPGGIGDGLSSPRFTCVNSFWKLVVYPEGETEEFKDHVAVGLVKISGEEIPMLVKLKLSISYNNLLKYTSNHKFLYKRNGTEFGVQNWIEKNKVLGGYFINDDNSLVFKCELEIGMIGTASNDTCCGTEYIQNDSTLRNLSDHMSSLFENKNYSDVVLIAEGFEIKAHKAILSSRSSVFASMFNSEMSEAKENRVIISDIKKEVLGEFLYFVYTGKTHFLTVDFAMKLYEAADKYNVDNLHKLCANFLQASFTKDNVSSILLLAHKHSDEALKEASKTYIHFHLAGVIKTQGWEEAIEEQPCLATEVLTGIVLDTFPTPPTSTSFTIPSLSTPTFPSALSMGSFEFSPNSLSNS